MILVVSISQQSSHKQSQRLWRLAEENKQYDSSHSKEINTQPKDVTSWSELQKRRLIESFHQADLTEIQAIKGLNRRTIYRTFKAINENKGIQTRPESGRNSSISKSNFKIIKKFLEVDNGFQPLSCKTKYLKKKESK